MSYIKNLLGLSYYISELDEFLIEYDSTHPKLSAQQRKEIEKYSKIFLKRDYPSSSTASQNDAIWEKF